MNATFDEYKTFTEAQIARHEVSSTDWKINRVFKVLKQSEYQALKEKLEAAQGELAALTAKHNNLQKTFETERTTWTNDKKLLEDTIVDMSTSEKHSESDRTAREKEVHQQEERAKVHHNIEYESRAFSNLVLGCWRTIY